MAHSLETGKALADSVSGEDTKLLSGGQIKLSVSTHGGGEESLWGLF
jgi:hypothetical protein